MESIDPWKPFTDMENNPWQEVRKHKSVNNGPVIGHLLPDVPEEILHAAGAFPVAIEGASSRVSLSQAHIPGYTCSHVMGTLDMGLSGELDFLDGLVTKVYEFGNKKVTEHLCGIYEFLEKKKMDSLRELEK